MLLLCYWAIGLLGSRAVGLFGSLALGLLGFMSIWLLGCYAIGLWALEAKPDHGQVGVALGSDGFPVLWPWSPWCFLGLKLGGALMGGGKS